MDRVFSSEEFRKLELDFQSGGDSRRLYHTFITDGETINYKRKTPKGKFRMVSLGMWVRGEEGDREYSSPRVFIDKLHPLTRSVSMAESSARILNAILTGSYSSDRGVIVGGYIFDFWAIGIDLHSLERDIVTNAVKDLAMYANIVMDEYEKIRSAFVLDRNYMTVRDCLEGYNPQTDDLDKILTEYGLTQKQIGSIKADKRLQIGRVGATIRQKGILMRRLPCDLGISEEEAEALIRREDRLRTVESRYAGRINNIVEPVVQQVPDDLKTRLLSYVGAESVIPISRQ